MRDAKAWTGTLEDSGLRLLLEALRCAWTAGTSFSPDRWLPETPSIGQCAVTALIVQDAYGGELLRGASPEGSHYWNRLPSGLEVDLTADQFNSSPSFGVIEVRSRAYVLSFPETSARYTALRQRVSAIQTHPQRDLQVSER